MAAFICSTCGTQYPPSEVPPAQCPVCEDERQYIPPEGQSWTTLERLKISHLNGFRQYEPGLIGIGTQPKFAIGQRALLLCTPEGNIGLLRYVQGGVKSEPPSTHEPPEPNQ